MESLRVGHSLDYTVVTNLTHNGNCLIFPDIRVYSFDVLTGLSLLMIAVYKEPFSLVLELELFLSLFLFLQLAILANISALLLS